MNGSAARRNVIVECRAILFDMDGTLVDSTSVVERQWKVFAERHGLDYERLMWISHGRRNAETIREIAPHLATPEILAEFDASELQDREGVTAVKGAAHLIAQLADHEWAVVTSASRALAQDRLQAANLPVPEVLIGADDVRHGKPDPDGYLAAAQKMGLEPQFCLVFEDTVPGLQAGQAAGMRAIGITTTFPYARLGRVDCIADFENTTVSRTADGVQLSLLCY